MNIEAVQSDIPTAKMGFSTAEKFMIWHGIFTISVVTSMNNPTTRKDMP